MRGSFLLLLFNLGFFAAYSQQPDPTADADSVVVDSLEVAEAEEEMLYKEDTADFVYYALPADLEYIPGDDSPDVIAGRLSRIQGSIPLTYNERIHAFINYFTVKDREYTKMVMRRKNLYFPVFEKCLAKYGLPDELKYLSIIESGLNPRAVSRARAVGLWQFMSATGRYFDLHQDAYIDERMDPEKSTDAACRYLQQLYTIFGDWELVLAAYNSGPGNVKRAIRRSGYKHSFWGAYSHLPRETRSYVPQFVAIVYTMNYLEEHNFINEGEEMLMPHDTLMVSKFLNFETFAQLTGLCVEDLQKLNPSVRYNALPDVAKPYTIWVPSIVKPMLDVNRKEILDSASRVGKTQVEAMARNSEGSTYGRDRIVYKVKSGDVLGAIAMRHGVRLNDLKRWNNLRSNTIHIGQRLNIWLRPGKSQSVLASNNSARARAIVSINGSKTYTVQPGDTLWTISKKFEGLTVERIKLLNKLSDNKIQAGQKLVIGI